MREARKIAKVFRDEFPVVALDDPEPNHISEAIKLGFDLIMSISTKNLNKILKFAENSVAYVITPSNGKSDLKFMIFEVESIVSKLSNRNIEKIILDPILNPLIEPGMLKSLHAYKMFRDYFKDKPLMMGLCNVVELLDADSIGVNALLVMLAGELGVSTLLTVEESFKTRGSTLEISIATEMCSISLYKKKPPKDLGVNLLILKDKEDKSLTLNLEHYRNIRVFYEEEPKTRIMGPMGFFRIFMDRKHGEIQVLYEGKKGKILIKGKNAKSIMNKIIQLKLISKMEHAAYLAMELLKAEYALNFFKSYIQDEPLFRRRYL